MTEDTEITVVVQEELTKDTKDDLNSLLDDIIDIMYTHLYAYDSIKWDKEITITFTKLYD